MGNKKRRREKEKEATQDEKRLCRRDCFFPSGQERMCPPPCLSFSLPLGAVSISFLGKSFSCPKPGALICTARHAPWKGFSSLSEGDLNRREYIFFEVRPTAVSADSRYPLYWNIEGLPTYEKHVVNCACNENVYARRSQSQIQILYLFAGQVLCPFLRSLKKFSPPLSLSFTHARKERGERNRLSGRH